MNAKDLKIVNVQELNNIAHDIAVLNTAIMSTDLEREYIFIALGNILRKLKDL